MFDMKPLHKALVGLCGMLDRRMPPPNIDCLAVSYISRSENDLKIMPQFKLNFSLSAPFPDHLGPTPILIEGIRLRGEDNKAHK